MEFIARCLDNLKKERRGNVHIYSGKTFFSLSRIKSLPQIVRNICTIGDLVITPYYFFGEQIFELYDYVLSIRVVETLQSKEQFFLEETGKKSNKEIDREVLEKLDNTFYEVLDGDIQTFLKSLEQYLKFMNGKENAIRVELNTIHYNVSDYGIFYELI